MLAAIVFECFSKGAVKLTQTNLFCRAVKAVRTEVDKKGQGSLLSAEVDTSGVQGTMWNILTSEGWGISDRFTG